METKHTPGEWKIKQDGNLIFVYADPNAEAICNVFSQRDGDGVFTDSKMNNAKLISAAPDMLEALFWAKAFGKNGGVHDKMIIEKIESAIKNATS